MAVGGTDPSNSQKFEGILELSWRLIRWNAYGAYFYHQSPL